MMEHLELDGSGKIDNSRSSVEAWILTSALKHLGEGNRSVHVCSPLTPGSENQPTSAAAPRSSSVSQLQGWGYRVEATRNLSGQDPQP